LNRKKSGQPSKSSSSELIRLNRFIANSGVCSRREADQLIERGLIKVNNEVVTLLGYKVKRGDTVIYKGKRLSPEKFIYVLLNKPKDYITTLRDPEGRKTVMELVSNACSERILPVGRLDRNTTGLLLFTNDGQLAGKLSHPSHKVRKIYRVTLDKPVSKSDLDAIALGVKLEDGVVEIDDLAILNKDKTELGLELHSGKNRIVRRLFESLKYDVIKLDRAVYAGLTKKNLARGRWRFLTEREIGMLNKGL
jgi:23S rRNA pseudouridine2605 synthase